MKVEGPKEELKYLEYFGLEFNPFPVAPDVENFFLSQNIDRLVTEIVHGVLTRKGFMVLTGEIGLGKTTISRKIISILEEKGVETSLVFHTAYQDVELLREINLDFGSHAVSLDFASQMKLLNSFLLNENRKGKNCAIIIDDAQNLNHKSLELIRMISNLETDQEKLVQILLIGQPELIDKLNSPDLRQLKSRIIIREEARPLDVEELKNYLLFKLNAAGNKGKAAIKNNAVKRIYQLSKGNFRQVNILTDRCLYVGFLRNTTEISKAIVNEAYEDLSPDTSPNFGRALIVGLSTLVTLCVIGGIIYFRSYRMAFKDSVRETVSLSSRITASTGEQLASHTKQFVGSQESETPSVATIPEAQEVEKSPIVPSPVVDFLRAYHLSEYEEAFFEASKNHQYQRVSETIFEQTGLRLIQLEYLPDRIRERYGVLAYPSVPGGKERYFLFWRPVLRLREFYLGYYGEEIRLLQEMLAHGHFYNDEPDGTVGENLMKAVLIFQAQMGLPTTGFPDERTIFLLCHLQGATAHDS